MPELLRLSVGAPDDVPSHVTDTPVGFPSACFLTCTSPLHFSDRHTGAVVMRVISDDAPRHYIGNMP